MKFTVKNLILMCGLLAVLPMTSCSDNEPDNTVTVNLVNTKILQKSGIQKNEVIELIYRGFI